MPILVARLLPIGTALGALGVQEPTAFDYATFFSGFMASSVVWALCFAALVDRALRRAGARWAQLTYRAGAIAFLALALSSLRDVLVSRYPSATIRQPSAFTGEP